MSCPFILTHTRAHASTFRQERSLRFYSYDPLTPTIKQLLYRLCCIGSYSSVCTLPSTKDRRTPRCDPLRFTTLRRTPTLRIFFFFQILGLFFVARVHGTQNEIDVYFKFGESEKENFSANECSCKEQASASSHRRRALNYLSPIHRYSLGSNVAIEVCTNVGAWEKEGMRWRGNGKRTPQRLDRGGSSGKRRRFPRGSLGKRPAAESRISRSDIALLSSPSLRTSTSLLMTFTRGWRRTHAHIYTYVRSLRYHMPSLLRESAPSLERAVSWIPTARTARTCRSEGARKTE